MSQATHEQSIGVDPVRQTLVDVAHNLYGEGVPLEMYPATVDEPTEHVALVTLGNGREVIAANLIYHLHPGESVDPGSMTAQARKGLEILNALGVDDLFGFKISVTRAVAQEDPTPKKTSILRRIIARPAQDSDTDRGVVYAVEYPPPEKFVDAWNGFCDYARQREPSMNGMPRFKSFSDHDLYTPQEYVAAREEGLFLISTRYFDHDFIGHVLGAALLSPESNAAQSQYGSEHLLKTDEEHVPVLMRHLDWSVSTTPSSVVQPPAHGNDSAVTNPDAIARYRDGFGVDNERAAQLLMADQAHFARLARLLREYTAGHKIAS